MPATLALSDAILTFKSLRGLAPKYLSSHFNTRASARGRDTKNKKASYISQRWTQLLVSALLYIERWNAGTCCLKKLLNVKVHTVLNLKLRAIFNLEIIFSKLLWWTRFHSFAPSLLHSITTRYTFGNPGGSSYMKLEGNECSSENLNLTPTEDLCGRCLSFIITYQGSSSWLLTRFKAPCVETIMYPKLSR